MSTVLARTNPTTGEQDVLTRISTLITRLTGVQLGEKQRHMVESRLRKRALELDVKDLVEYYAYFTAHESIETQALISLLTTHHTYFFREFAHFDYLIQTGLRQVVEAAKKRGDNTIRAWSAACSRGQEVYSLAMILDYHLKQIAPGMKFEILGTDVDPESVMLARNGVYHRRDIKEVPVTYLGTHWARGTGEIAEFVKAKASLKDHCKFEPLNLIEPSGMTKLPLFDVVFCRNVFIYFAPDQIRTITQGLMRQLQPDGFLFIGISETLHGLGVEAQSIGPSIYSHPVKGAKPGLAAIPGGKTAGAAPSATVSAPPALRAVEAKPLRVLCVDDSPSILTLMKMIFTKEAGFDLVGTAVNGVDAQKKVADLKPDVLTLDIHMPEMDGIEYLRKNFGARHPAVVMVSSVSRDNADLALKALEIGASDYIEKPALNQLKDRTEEIRMKVRCAVANRAGSNAAANASISGSSGPSKLDQEFKKQMRIAKPEESLRLFVGAFSERGAIVKSLKELSGTFPPALVLFEQAATTLPAFAQMIAKESGMKVEALEQAGGKLQPGKVYVGDFHGQWKSVAQQYAGRGVAVLVYGEPTPKVCQEVSGWRGPQVLIEETASGDRHPLYAAASDQFPATSFVALSQEFLSAFGDKKK